MNIDTQYEVKASGFLKKAVAGLICAAFPIASIVAIFLGVGNHKAIVDYVAAGGLYTPKIKTSATLSRGGDFRRYRYDHHICYLFPLFYFVDSGSRIFYSAESELKYQKISHLRLQIVLSYCYILYKQ